MTKLILLIILIVITGCGQSEAEIAYPALLEKFNSLQAENLDLSGRYTSLNEKYGQLITDKQKVDDALLAEQNTNRQLDVNNQVLKNQVAALQANYSAIEELISRSSADKDTTIQSLKTQLEATQKLLADEKAKLNQDWSSLEELAAFFKDHRAELVINLIAGEDGKAQTDNQCIARCLAWRELAEKYGKNLEVQSASPAENLKWFNKQKDGYHAVLLAIVEKYKLYWIDAETFIIKQVGYVP